MVQVQFIRSLDLPELEPYRTLRRTAEHERRGIFVAEGAKVVERLLQTRLKVISVLVTPEWLEKLRSDLERRSEIATAFVAERSLLETLVGFDLFQGVLALAQIPPPATLESVLCESSRPHLLVAVDGLTNSENLGVVVRNCAAFGVRGLLVGETSSSPWLRRAVRNSMGAVFHLPVVPTNSLTGQLRELAACGFATIAAHPHASGRTLPQADFRRDVCVVFGSEGSGISPEVLEACTERVAIPMPPRVDSLNVSSAAAVFLYEAARQRG